MSQSLSQPCTSTDPSTTPTQVTCPPLTYASHFVPVSSSSSPTSPYGHHRSPVMSQNSASSAALAMGSYGPFAYGPFVPSANGTSTSSSHQYFHGGAFATGYGASEPSPSPPSQSSSSCHQQNFDYSSVYYSQSAAAAAAGYYSQNPYLPSSGSFVPPSSSSNLTSAASVLSSASSSPTYHSPSVHAGPTDSTNLQYSHLDTHTPPAKGPLDLVANGIACPTNPGVKKGTGVKSARGRGRRTINPSPSPENSLDRVFIWDLDETLIIFYTLLTGSFAQKYNKDETSMRYYGKQMEKLVYDLGDCQFFYNDLDECDQVHIDDVATDDTGQDLTSYDFESDGFRDTRQSNSLAIPSAMRGGVDWMRKLAFRYRKIKEVYNQYRNQVEVLLGDRSSEWIDIRGNIEKATDGWLTLASKCLHLISQREKCANVLVTPTPLVFAISKVLLHQLGPYFPIENIYSSAKVGKEHVFEKLMQKYGKTCTFVVIGDGRDEESAAQKLQMPFWRITGRNDLENLYRALEYEIL